MNYSDGLLTNISTPSANLQTYTNYINYTQQAASRAYKTFSEPLNNTKILLFLTTFFILGNNEGASSSTLRPIDYYVEAEVSSTSEYYMQVNLTT